MPAIEFTLVTKRALMDALKKIQTLPAEGVVHAHELAASQKDGQIYLQFLLDNRLVGGMNPQRSNGNDEGVIAIQNIYVTNLGREFLKNPTST